MFLVSTLFCLDQIWTILTSSYFIQPYHNIIRIYHFYNNSTVWSTNINKRSKEVVSCLACMIPITNQKMNLNMAVNSSCPQCVIYFRPVPVICGHICMWKVIKYSKINTVHLFEIYWKPCTIFIQSKMIPIHFTGIHEPCLGRKHPGLEPTKCLVCLLLIFMSLHVNHTHIFVTLKYCQSMS